MIPWFPNTQVLFCLLVQNSKSIKLCGSACFHLPAVVLWHMSIIILCVCVFWGLPILYYKMLQTHLVYFLPPSFYHSIALLFPECYVNGIKYHVAFSYSFLFFFFFFLFGSVCLGLIHAFVWLDSAFLFFSLNSISS